MWTCSPVMGTAVAPAPANESIRKGVDGRPLPTRPASINSCRSTFEWRTISEYLAASCEISLLREQHGSRQSATRSDEQPSRTRFGIDATASVCCLTKSTTSLRCASDARSRLHEYVHERIDILHRCFRSCWCRCLRRPHHMARTEGKTRYTGSSRRSWATGSTRTTRRCRSKWQ